MNPGALTLIQYGMIFEVVEQVALKSLDMTIPQRHVFQQR